MIRTKTLAIASVVVLVASMAFGAPPSGWADPQIVTITGQGSPYDGSYTLHWQDDDPAGFQGDGPGWTGGITDLSGAGGTGVLDWNLDGSITGAVGAYGGSWSNIVPVGIGSGWHGQVNVPEGGLTVASGLFFDQLVSAAMSSSVVAALIVSTSITLLLVGVLLLVLRRRLRGMCSASPSGRGRPARGGGVYVGAVGVKRWNQGHGPSGRLTWRGSRNKKAPSVRR